MKNAILHKDDNGNNLITHVASGYDLTKVQEEVGGIIIPMAGSGLDAQFLNAYDIVSGNAVLDLEKAREAKVEMIRQKRNEMFVEFDKRYDIAVKDGADLTLLVQERGKLKDLPEKASLYLDSCISFDEVKSLNVGMIF